MLGVNSKQQSIKEIREIMNGMWQKYLDIVNIQMLWVVDAKLNINIFLLVIQNMYQQTRRHSHICMLWCCHLKVSHYKCRLKMIFKTIAG